MKRSVLVVDDSRVTREFITEAIEGLADDGSLEVEVVQSSSGFEAVRLLPGRRFDLVVTDINMPDLHGLELLRILKQAHGAGLPVVLVSSEASARDIERGLSLGAVEYLTKPFTPEQIQTIVRRLLVADAEVGGSTGAPQEPAE